MRLSDIALATLATARLSRLVITDKLGHWWIQEPVARAMSDYAAHEIARAAEEDRDPVEPAWWRYEQGLQCPWCVGFWLGAGVLTAGAIATRRPGIARTAWRLGAGSLALNYVTAHLGSHLGDFDTDDIDPEDDAR